MRISALGTSILEWIWSKMQQKLEVMTHDLEVEITDSFLTVATRVMKWCYYAEFYKCTSDEVL